MRVACQTIGELFVMCELASGTQPTDLEHGHALGKLAELYAHASFVAGPKSMRGPKYVVVQE